MSFNPSDTEIAAIRRQLAELDKQRRLLEQRLHELVRVSANQAAPHATGAAAIDAAPSPQTTAVTNSSPAAEKVALFRRLFAGRTDVFPARWNPNEWVRGVCGKPQIKCGECLTAALRS